MTGADLLPCDQVIAQLWEYIDGELSHERAALIRAHLDVCGHCFPQHDYQRAFLGFLRVHARSPVPPALRRLVFQGLLQEDGPPGA
ncbi:MAG TPA: zf-HC2 domain-containing protein [Longimicrobiaceae bacterium]|nr:zf-HC2 domain-containing protein [Longimicrobiaceae bacterium]